MHHFFLPADCFGGEMITFPPEVSKQIASVLRLKPGDRVVALDNRQNAWLVELVQVKSKQATGQALGAYDGLPAEPGLKLTVYVSLTQREKFELILQKCTELGASAFVPVINKRSLVQSAAEAETKRERWEAILREAAEQCGRLCIPALLPVMRWQQALNHARESQELALVLWEEEHETDLEAVFCANPLVERLALFIGPEGGITAEEIEQLEGENVLTVSLGQRILRMETAAIAATTIVLFKYGCMLPDGALPDDEPSGEDIPF